MLHVSNNRNGFSFIEIIIAISIIAILTLGTVTMARRYLKTARVSSTKSILQSAQGAIDGFYAEIGQYPTSLTDLIQPPADPKLKSKWHEAFWPKKTEPKDAWGETLVYKLTKGGAHPYELYSWGPNGEGSPSEEWIDVWEME